jgi:hypothetical protein
MPNDKTDLLYNFWDFHFACKGDQACKPADYTIALKDPSLSKKFEDAGKKLSVTDTSKCLVLTFKKAKLAPNSMVCIIDINENENAIKAITKGYTKTMIKTNIKNITPAKEGEVFDVSY